MSTKILGNEELNILRAKTPYSLPDNPSDKGFNARQIKTKFWEGYLLLFNWLKETQASLNNDFATTNSALLNESKRIDVILTYFSDGKANFAVKDRNNNIIDETYELKSEASTKFNQLIADIQSVERGSASTITGTQNINADGIQYTITLSNTQNANLSTITQYLPLATTLKAGLLSSTDKEKINNIESDLTNFLANAKAYTDEKLQRDNIVNILGAASHTLIGLLSSEDKKKIDALYSLLGEKEDADTVVNTINEVLAIFSSYPEGVDIVSQLEKKVNYSDVINTLDSEETSKPLSAKMGKELKTEVDTKAELAYVNEELDKKALKSDILVIDEAVTAQESEIATTQSEADKLVDEIVGYVDGSPRGVYASLSALQSAFPSGAQGVYVTTDNGHWYYWSGTAWTDGGVYQATEIGENSVGHDELDVCSKVKQDYSVLDKIKNGIETYNSYTNRSLNICSKPVEYSGYIWLEFYSNSVSTLKIFIATKSGSTYTITKTSSVEIKQGWNKLKPKLIANVGEYIGVYALENCSKFANNANFGVNTLYKAYNGSLSVNEELSSFTDNPNIIFAWDYSINESKSGCVNTDNIDDNSISNKKIIDGAVDQRVLSISSNILQDYSVVEYLHTFNLANYSNEVLSIESKIVAYDGYLFLNFNSNKESKIKLCILEKNDTYFKIKNIKEFYVKSGWNIIKTDIIVNQGDYIGVVSKIETSTYYGNNTNEIFHYYNGYVYDNANVGTNFTSYHSNKSVLFGWDYMVDEKNGCVGTKNLDDNSVTENKLSNEVKAKLNSNNCITNISNILYNTSKTIKIKLIGDSITYGQCSSDRNNKSWAGLLKNYFESHFNCVVINAGISGINSSYIRDHISELISNDDDIVICMIGTNNRNNQEAYNALYTDLTLTEKYCIDRNIKFIPMASIPANLVDESTRYKHMSDINHIISAWAVDHKYELINLYEEFYKYCDYDNSKLNSLLYDGLHPNDDGYYIIFRIVCEHLGVKTPIKDANW